MAAGSFPAVIFAPSSPAALKPAQHLPGFHGLRAGSDPNIMGLDTLTQRIQIPFVS